MDDTDFNDTRTEINSAPFNNRMDCTNNIAQKRNKSSIHKNLTETISPDPPFISSRAIIFHTSSTTSFYINVFIVLLVLLSMLLSNHCTLAENLKLQPVKHDSQTKDALLIIIPEKGVRPLDYQTFGRSIQKHYPSTLWVEIVELPNTGELTLDILPLLLTESGHPSPRKHKRRDISPNKKQDVFLAAHGHYGHLAAEYAGAVPESLRGLILLGAFLPKRWTVASFPLPVLTISGEIDGVTRITRMADALGRMLSDVMFEPSLVTQSPFVLLEDCNHAAFISGKLPTQMHLMDIAPHIDQSNSLEKAANMTSLFLVHTLQQHRPLIQEAEVVFLNAFEQAKTLTKPIREVIEMTQDNSLKSYWVKAAQKWLSGLEGKESTFLEVYSYVVDQSSLPPALVVEEGIPYVVTFSDIVRKKRDLSEDPAALHSLAMEMSAVDEEDSGIAPQAPKEIAARMMGPERIRAFLHNTSIAKNYTCRDLNYAFFMTAYHMASQRARQRFDDLDRGVLFQNDFTTDSEAVWENTELKIELIKQQIHVTSIAYQTAHEDSLAEYSGLFYCKLLPPGRALEWIYVDSLRRGLPTEL